MRKIALLFAGQGAQSVGMGADLPGAADLFAQADAALGRPLSRITFGGPIEELTRTANCQPALYTHGIACLRALEDAIGPIPFQAAAGLSLGEFTAHAAAGTFDFATGLRLVARRGEFMDAACEATSGTMAALVGGEPAQVAELAQSADVDVANLNAPGQIVLSGERDKIADAIARAKDFGIRRAVPLTVAGAYHSRLMTHAREQLAAEIATVTPARPRVPVISNVTAQPALDPGEIARTLVQQVTSPVRWAESMETLLADGFDLFVELGPGAVLAGLLARIRKGTEVLSITDRASLDAAIEPLRAAIR